MRRLVIVTGLSGAGKSQAMKSFEDFGFACLDNVPPVLAAPYVALVRDSGRERAALAFDARSGGTFGEPLAALETLAAGALRPQVLFLDADDAALVRRYSETRRRHPFADAGASLLEAIAAERHSLEGLRARADVVWDTTDLTLGMLKDRIAQTFADDGRDRIHVSVIAFGYKHGIPRDADFVFDVRFLPNPHYDPLLRPLTGAHPAVAAALESAAELEPFLERLFALVDFVVPHAQAEGKSQLTFAVGCTGGRHRSVYVARRLAEHVGELGFPVAALDRDLPAG